MVWAVILAAGQGSRMAEATGGLAKQFVAWQGAPLYWHSARMFARCARVQGVVLVLPPLALPDEQTRVSDLLMRDPLGVPCHVVAGGVLRQDSVRHGLSVLPEACRKVLIHDAARPFASPALVNRLLDTLESDPDAVGAIPALSVVDTIKEVIGETVVATLNRETLVAVQTPQAFHLAALRQGHEQALEQAWTVTDDASLLERCGYTVRVVIGEAQNQKITTPEDLVMLEEPLVSTPCVGHGYDVHRFAGEEAGRQPARPMRLGGVAIPKAPEVLAHSDGDVLLHALMDALLGCAGQGDIGQHFPDSSAAFDNVNSAVLLDQVLDKVREADIRITHADLTIIAEVPKITPHREAIRGNIARLLGLPRQAVNVKATTEEGLGFTGERLGIKAVAVVTGVRKG